MSTTHRDDATDRLAADLNAVRTKLATTHRAVRAFTGSVIIVVVFSMATAAVEVQRFAVEAGFDHRAAWALDPVVGLALIVLMFGEALIADAGRKPPWIGATGRHFAGLVTLLMNCWPSFADRAWDGVLLHAVMPGLLILFASAAPQFRRALADITTRLRADEDRLMQAQRDIVDGAVAEQVAHAQAVEQQHADAVHAREQEASRLRVEEAERLARIQADADARRIQAEADADIARQTAAANTAHAAAERVRAEADAESARIREESAAEVARIQAEASAKALQQRPRTASAKAPAKPSAPAPDKDDAARWVASAIRDHEGPDPYVFEWKTWAQKHGGGRTFWFAAKQAAEARPHLAKAAG
jgi:hypothetical protein